jgi:hypothetical protein
MYKNAMKCKETLSKWCKNKHGASKIMDTLETYQCREELLDPPDLGSMTAADRDVFLEN